MKRARESENEQPQANDILRYFVHIPVLNRNLVVPFNQQRTVGKSKLYPNSNYWI